MPSMPHPAESGDRSRVVRVVANGSIFKALKKKSISGKFYYARTRLLLESPERFCILIQGLLGAICFGYALHAFYGLGNSTIKCAFDGVAIRGYA